MEFSTVTLTNIEIAGVQLERALKLFLEEKDYISSLTLAGASEEILGKVLKGAGEKSALEEDVDESERMAHEIGVEPSSASDARYLLNYFRNKLKHINLEEPLHFSANYYAAEMISRAVRNYLKVTGKESPNMVSFRMITHSCNLR